MHEASLVAGLLSRVAEIAPPPARVLQVHLRVGAMAGANAEAMEFAFTALRGECLGEQAELVIEHTSGGELDLVAIEVDDVNDDTHRGETPRQERRTGRDQPQTVG